ncbi:SMC-Scp complex subunit ScpB [Micromonospora sp. LH3U1]|uniref:SMC-Scp complex subunit ScpB n=1 Tax=Micromonospora sp. LH3U1 TaxID=3018339 RepID=UPI0023496BF7|nr:SMC-Scp complex subunit ScpB [Micromonospora sp. LH3U1]WCN83805.1 SMC-Scp complex subunit ScpB [Micromonospora sp. LH3U1]
MSDEERRDSGDSLADQAAAWIPPWERPRPPASTAASTASSTAAEANDDSGVDVPLDASGTAAPATGAPVVGADRGGKPSLPGPESLDEPGEPTEAVEADELVEPGGAGGDPAGSAADAADAGAQAVPRRQPAARRRAPVVPEPAPELSDAELRGALEAILLVVDEPVSELVLAQVLEQPAERVGPMLDEIAAGYTSAGHGFELRRAAGGWRLYTRPEYATYVERFVLDGQSVRLTQAALETLAVVAYKQPVTRSRISAIRGVNCDGVIRTLVTRGLVEECGTETDSGAFLYKTTTLFLEKLGLNTVDELPPLAPFLPDDVEELADATR